MLTQEQRARRALMARLRIQRIKADPEQWAKHIAIRDVRSKRNQAARTKRRRCESPEQRDERLAKMRPKWRERELRRPSRHRELPSSAKGAPTGSVLITAASSVWRDLLARITAEAPRTEDRDEIIAEAALRVLEGQSVTDAVRGAAKLVGRAAGWQRQAVQIEACYWL